MIDLIVTNAKPDGHDALMTRFGVPILSVGEEFDAFRATNEIFPSHEPGVHDPQNVGFE
jgi:hypothetical protein